MAVSRFDRLEPERAPEEAASKGGASRLEGRFGGSAEGRTDHGPARSGGEPARFEQEKGAGDSLRLLDTDVGQAFVRCARCRADNHVTAGRCSNCEADLATAEQRAFNEALYRRLQAEKVEEERAVLELRERRAAAEREQKEAMRQRQVLEVELERRRELGLPLDDQDDVSEPVVAMGRALGRALGQALARVLPDRRWRRGIVRGVAALGGGGLALALLGVFGDFAFAVAFLLVSVLAGIYVGRRRGPRAGR
jgi:hypothetical protein